MLILILFIQKKIFEEFEQRFNSCIEWKFCHKSTAEAIEKNVILKTIEINFEVYKSKPILKTRIYWQTWNTKFDHLHLPIAFPHRHQYRGQWFYLAIRYSNRRYCLTRNTCLLIEKVLKIVRCDQGMSSSSFIMNSKWAFRIFTISNERKNTFPLKSMLVEINVQLINESRDCCALCTRDKNTCTSLFVTQLTSVCSNSSPSLIPGIRVFPWVIVG